MIAPALTRNDRNLSALAAGCAALVFVVVAASAWLRLAAVPCPQGGCEAFVFADAVRLAHRVAAMGVTIVSLVIVALAWKSPAHWGRRVSAVAILALVAALAVVGRGSAGTPPPAVVLANLVGGLTLLAATAALAAAARAPRGRISLAFAAAAALLAAAVATGTVLSAAPPRDPAALVVVHQTASWLALVVWIALATGTTSAGAAQTAARLAALFLSVQVLLVLADAQGPAARWAHNLLTATALCAAFAGTWSCVASPAREPAARESGRPGH